MIIDLTLHFILKVALVIVHQDFTCSMPNMEEAKWSIAKVEIDQDLVNHINSQKLHFKT